MKTHRREMSREVLHERLSSGFGLTSEQQVDSEYGMCELLSQAYAMGDSWFETVPWMQVTVRDPDNPLRVLPAGEEEIGRASCRERRWRGECGGGLGEKKILRW